MKTNSRFGFFLSICSITNQPNAYNIKYRPDFYFDCDNYAIVLEIDEYRHSRYDEELERMYKLKMAIGKPTRFIRYNPDHKTSSKEERHIKIRQTLDFHLNLVELTELEPVYLFYA